MGNKLGGTNGKSLAVDDANSTELKRILAAFKSFAGPADTITRDQFLNDVFGGFLPFSFGNRLFESFGGSKKGITTKELTDGIAVFFSSDPKTRIKFVFRFYAADPNGDVIQKDEFLRKLREDQNIPENISTLFTGDSTMVDFNSFASWVQNNPEAIDLHRLLNQGLSLTAMPEKFIPSFHQVLAGITHFSEENIATLERTFWQLVNSSPCHQFDCHVFLRVVSPPLSVGKLVLHVRGAPIRSLSSLDVAKLLFTAFDDRCDGIIDLRELAAGISAACYGPVVERTKFIFRLFDTDEDGLLNPEEIDLMLAAMLKSQVLLQSNTSSSSSGSVLFLLSDIANIRENILQTSAGLFQNNTDRPTGLDLEQFLQWTLTCSLHQPFLELLFQVCHVAFGVRPPEKSEEGKIIKSYLERCDATELIPNDNIYLIPLAWWSSWCAFVGLGIPAKNASVVQLPKSGSSQTIQKMASRQSTKAAASGEVEANLRQLSPTDLVIETPSGNVKPSGSSRPILRAGRFSANKDVEIKTLIEPPASPGVIDTLPLLSNLSPPSDHNKLCLTGDNFRPLRIQMAPFIPGYGFEVLPPSVWLAFQAWYGVKATSPPVIRRVIMNQTSSLAEIEYQPVKLIFIRQSQPANNSSHHYLNNNVSMLGSAASFVKSVFGATTVCAYPGVAAQPYSNQLTPGNGSIPTLSASVSQIDVSSQQNSSSSTSNGDSKYYDAAYGFYSRTNTLGDVIKSFLTRFHLHQDSIRLWHLKSGPVSTGRRNLIWSPGELDSVNIGLSLSIPNEDLNVLEYRILIEVANLDQTWPEDSYLAVSASVTGRDSPQPSDSADSVSTSTGGLVGFQNLGNTCFMNAALQCLSNTPPLTRYFLRNIHLHELNINNPLGFHGLVALRYAELISMVWASGSPKPNQKPLSPAKIKNLIAKTWRQFGDSDQQDAQELMTFLLDGLHEDLNRRRRKAANSAASAEVQANSDEVASCEPELKGVQLAWKNHYQANNSVIVDLFHGLLSFEIKCPMCNNPSKTFDPFNYLVLPLPADRKVTIELTVIFLDASRMPLRIGVRVTSGTSCRDIYLQSSKVLFGKDQEAVAEERFLLAEVLNSSITRFFDVSEKLGQIMGELILYEVAPPKLSPEASSLKYQVNQLDEEAESQHYHYDGRSASCDQERCQQRFALYNQLCVPKRWQDRFLIIINRQLVAIQKYILPQLNWRPQLFGRPYLVPIPKGSSPEFRKRIYSDVWDRTQRFLTTNSNKQDPRFTIVPNSRGGNYARDGDFPPESNEKPFPFDLCRVAGPQCQRCSTCPWNNFCRGCTIPYGEEDGKTEADNFASLFSLGGPFVAINWDPRTIFLFFSHQAESSFQTHESVEMCRKKAIEPLSLYDCLSTFAQHEPVDGYSCDNKECPSKAEKTEDQSEPSGPTTVTASSHMSIAKLPPMLIVHLKRFYMARDGRWMKSSRAINVPLDALNLAEFMATGESLVESGSFKYRLYAAVCHYGAMRSGHYVTYAKHQPSGVWYFFDDTSVREVQPADIDMSAVYLLFFERVGVDYDSLLPQIDESIVPMTAAEALQAAEAAEKQRLAEVQNRNTQTGQGGAISNSGRCSIQ